MVAWGIVVSMYLCATKCEYIFGKICINVLLVIYCKHLKYYHFPEIQPDEHITSIGNQYSPARPCEYESCCATTNHRSLAGKMCIYFFFPFFFCIEFFSFFFDTKWRQETYQFANEKLENFKKSVTNVTCLERSELHLFKIDKNCEMLQLLPNSIAIVSLLFSQFP